MRISTSAKALALMIIGLTLTLSSCAVVTPNASKTPPQSQPSASTKAQTELYDFVTETSGFVPYVEGMNLARARAEVEASGLEAYFFDSSPLAQAIENENDWIVFKQPTVGQEHPRNTEIRFGAHRKGDPVDDTESKFAFELRRDDLVAPNFVGMRLSDVKDTAKEIGLYLFTKDASGEDRSVFDSDNWEVVKQDRVPGYLMSSRSMEIHIQKLGEKFVEVDYKDAHYGEMQFFGRITGYEGETAEFLGPPAIQFVEVDGADIALDLISPYSYACQGAGDAGLAEEAKRNALPIGSLVRVVRTNPERPEDGVVHLVAKYDPLHPFANSANQQLVEGGYWIPTDGTNYFDVAYSSKLKFKIETKPDLKTKAEYLNLFVTAANKARAQKIGGYPVCLGMALKYEAQLRKEAIERKRDEARWAREVERQRQLWLEAHSCAGGARDGDGDGICNEG